MGDMYGYGYGCGSCNISHSSSPTLSPSLIDPDQFSPHILLPPSNASSLLQDVISAVASSSALATSTTISNNVSEYDTDHDYHCQTQGAIVEAMAEEVPTKSVPTRISSKRSRTAEVHNLSEKRRRSRINQKMKALQNLIPNSNKSDKASMLDEAIEYLKQLQLQVQMLSMRNGLSLHHMCLPQGLQPLQLAQMRMECGEENRSNPLNLAATTTLPLHHSSSFPNKHTLPSPPNIINSETFFGYLELTRSSEICRGDVLQHQHLNANNSDTNTFGCSQGTLATVSLCFDMKASEVNDNWERGLQEEISRKSEH